MKNISKKLLNFLLVFLLSFVVFIGVDNYTKAYAEIIPPSKGNEFVYLFKGNQYILYDLTKDKQLDNYPLPLNNSTWPGLPWTSIDAAFTNPLDKNIAYIFKGNEYIAYNLKEDRVFDGYPYKISSTWTGLTFSSIDAIIPTNGNIVYFVKGDQYTAYDMKADRACAGYPYKFNSSTWPGIPWTSIDSAVTTVDNICYMLKGTEYIKYDLNLDKTVQQPLPISKYWPGISFASDIKGAITVGFRSNEEVKADKIIAEARAHMPFVTYVYGVDDAARHIFDCSSFTKHIFAHQGISLGRTTWDQMEQGVEVSQANLRAGDLVFTLGGDHVGIYTSNGKMIHNSREGINVIESNITDFYKARRIL